MDLMSEEEEAYTDGENMERDIESIKFRNVSFKYEIDEDLMKDQRDELMFSDEFDSEKNNNTNILEDVSFEIKGGSTVALVGPSGSGKSTIVKLLYRFYHPQSGEILVNGKPITSYNVNSVRENMTLVSQDVFIFDGSVRENLILGRTDITDEEIENALKYSQSYDFVQKLSEGINTKLGERGIKISHGQKQRLSIARSIIKKANIVILDEPTSALDVDTEALFQKNLSEWSEGSTKIIIAHRLTTIRNADYVLFLDDGKVIEQGSPQELIRQNGRFREFWEKQFIFTEDGSTVI
ncbi:atp-dependent permease mdl1 mitochondrial [Holotrichia oblita]|nr:atp-dependent permease mdl1 mitochondrial [Holotrichia oblita]